MDEANIALLNWVQFKPKMRYHRKRNPSKVSTEVLIDLNFHLNQFQGNPKVDSLHEM